MYTPTEAVCEPDFSVTTLIPLERVADYAGRLYLRGSGISPRGKSPKFAIVGALENCKYDSVGTIWLSVSSKVLI